MSKKYVPAGAYLVCDKGTVISKLKNFEYSASVFGEGLCTTAHKNLVVNFDMFGACAMCNGSPCTAPVTNWMNVAEGISIDGEELLLENSELPCTLGGKIKIYLSKQTAQANLPKKKKKFWDFLNDGFDTIVDFETGRLQGLWTGLKGTAVALYDLGAWTVKHNDIYKYYNPAEYYEQLHKDAQTMEALEKLAKKGGKWLYRNSTYNMYTNPADYYLAQMENQQMMDMLYEKAANMSAKECGNLTGQLNFEVITEIATAGTATVITAVKIVDKTADIAKVAKTIDKTTDAIKTIDKTAKIAGETRKLERIKDVTKVEDFKPVELGDVTHKTNEIIEIGGKKGKGWNKRLNKELEPNSIYNVDNYKFHTDSKGRVSKVEGKLELKPRGRNNYQQRKSVKIKDGINGDQGGHLIGDRFNGPAEQINYVPQKGSLNQGAYKKMENDWAKALDNDKSVKVKIENIYDGNSKRPIGQTVEYKIDGKVTLIDFEN